MKQMPPEEIMDKLELEIEGMSCGHCVAAVSEALRELDGVSVDGVRIGSAEVSYEPARVSAEQIVLAVEDAGYTAQPKGQ
ncbi:MAG TPA: heavy-metal-associated domain-containing protein [Gemmatimonadaceae bacterium]|nr:heavy-metal-associated domain-containing protein [Gemmatimonadaceae bacterium]